MAIIHIDGPAKSGKSLTANMLRNDAISQGRGALLVDDTQNGEVRYLLEKIIVAASLTKPTPADDIPWKPDPLIILVGPKLAILDEFEALAPGFTAKFGPVKKMDTNASGILAL